MYLSELGPRNVQVTTARQRRVEVLESRLSLASEAAALRAEVEQAAKYTNLF